MTSRTRKARLDQTQGPGAGVSWAAGLPTPATVLKALETLADDLNRWQAGEVTDKAEAEAVAAVATLAEHSGNVGEAAAWFNAVAARVPLRLTIGVRRRPADRRAGPPSSQAQAGITVLPSEHRGGGPRASVSETLAARLIELWLLFLWQADWRRLRRCARVECLAWFVDRTRNASQQRCSDACTRAWWSTERRKAKKHKGYVGKQGGA